MEFNISGELKKLPEKPGVYIMKDEKDTIIYVGKAVVLKNRVKQYFMKSNKTARIEKMVSLITHFEYIVTDSEVEALILECNLIKKHRPKYNVLLKDDKTYPYIKINLKEDYPGIFVTRKIINDGAKYFGPYVDVGSLKELLNLIKKIFKVRQCKTFKSKTRECLNYHIDRCLAPCVKKVSKEEYRKMIDQIIALLDGKQEHVIKIIEEDIKKAAKNQDYEKAAFLRDKKIAIENLGAKQKVSNLNENNIDVIGIAKNELELCIEIFFVRGSKMIGREHYFITNTGDDDSFIISGFIKQYYVEKENLPNKIMIKEEIEDLKIIEEWLKLEIKTPKKGEKLKFIEMAEKNAEITLNNKTESKENLLITLKELLGIEKLPRKIESYDISHISGTNMVGGMVALKDLEIKKNLQRIFKIKTVFKQDDPRCMEEVITRRLKHNDEKFGTLPDVIFVDGGITEIRAAKKAMEQYNLNIPVFGMIKDDKHRTKALINENREEIALTEELKNIVTNLQDEVHRVAITYHRKRREMEFIKKD